LASVAATAGETIAAGGTAEAAQVDALDEGAVEGHIAAVVEKAGTVDISFNAITPIPQPGTQGIAIAPVAGREGHRPHHGVHAIVFVDRAGSKGLGGLSYTYPDRLSDETIEIYFPLVESPLRKFQLDRCVIGLGTNVLIPIRQDLRRWAQWVEKLHEPF
jgi:hypothetical protein